MSQHCFGLFSGHLTKLLIKRVEDEFPGVYVINHTEPRGEKRGWFVCPNRGEPFDSTTARNVLDFARRRARGTDVQRLAQHSDVDENQPSGTGSRWGR